MTDHRTDLALSGDAERDCFFKISDELTLRYRTTGTGEVAVVFVPGWTMSCEVFEHQLRHFEGSTSFTALSYDPRSQGMSSQTPGGHYYEQHARDLKALLDHLGYNSVVLVGWSAGGIEVLEYLRVFGTQGVEGAVVLDIPPRMRGGDKRVEWADFGTIDHGDQDGELKAFTFDLQMDREAFNREFCAWMLQNPDKQSVEFFAQISSQTPDLVAVQLIMSLFFVDNTEIAEKLDGNVPVMYYVREDWRDVAMTWIQEHAPHAVVESHGHHAMFWEAPGVFNAALDAFLERVGTHEDSRRLGAETGNQA